MALVGPTHPYSGGIAQHTTRLALELEKRGHHVQVESWSAQYPKALYPGPDRVPGGAPEIGLPRTVREDLAWFNPFSWWSVGRRLRRQDVVAVSIPTPFHAVPYLVLLGALGQSVQSVGLVHNVLPHEPGPLDRLLMRWLLRRLHLVIVHGQAALDTATELGVAPERLSECSLPSPWPESSPVAPQVRAEGTAEGTAQDTPQSTSQSDPEGATGLRVLFFGTVRHYKGLDILLDALADTPEATLLIAGEFWDDEASYRDHIARRGLEPRVTIRAGYVPEAEFPELFARADVLALPYRSGTGSIVRELAFRFHLPVIATDVGAIAEGIEHDHTGMVVPAGDPGALAGALADALSHAAQPGVLARWREAVATRDDSQGALWESYCQAVLGGGASGQIAPGGGR